MEAGAAAAAAVPVDAGPAVVVPVQRLTIVPSSSEQRAMESE